MRGSVAAARGNVRKGVGPLAGLRNVLALARASGQGEGCNPSPAQGVCDHARID